MTASRNRQEAAMSEGSEKAAPKVRVRDNGPYMVTGNVPLRDKTPIVSEHGEPMTWKSGEVQTIDASYALCRCGASEKKPFCDGAHRNLEWDPTETAPTDTIAERATQYPGTGIDVYDDRPTCVHAGFCGNKVSNVWKMSPKTDDTVVRAQVMAMIEKCPSGALYYEVDGEIIEQSLPTEIGIVPDGPLFVSGGVEIERSDGQPVEIRNRVTLCRCGQSANKPFCDGAHKEAGFTG
jgi:CDGSH-type Zn-finger protein